ncbi:MAG: MBL fold metallo-hydrolase [Methanobacterium sp.]|jgi:glyoxylase-like metal-dependent hydrolase (beta-lactamase superfamily II)|nr:MBL fold metallo-hydrolase [Methanobacterium sp.]
MEVISGIHEIDTTAARSYLVVGDELTLIDTGLAGNTGKIINYVKNELKRDPTDIKLIIITHHHFDHIGSLDKLKKLTEAKVAVHKDDVDYVSGRKSQIGPAFFKFMVKVFKIVSHYQPVEPDIIMEDGDKIGEYQVIHTPGHTKGSICLYNPQNKTLFVGDNLKYVNGKLEGPGARLLPEPEKYKESMEKLARLDIEVIFCGHSKPITSHASQKLGEYLKTL